MGQKNRPQPQFQPQYRREKNQKADTCDDLRQKQGDEADSLEKLFVGKFIPVQTDGSQGSDDCGNRSGGQGDDQAVPYSLPDVPGPQDNLGEFFFTVAWKD